MMKKALRETQTPRALAVVRFGHRPPARPLQAPESQTGSITIHCAAKLSAQWNEKKRSERRKHCALAVVTRSQKILPRRRPPSRGRRTAKI